MPGQISISGFSRFIFRIFTVEAAVSAAEAKSLSRDYSLVAIAAAIRKATKFHPQIAQIYADYFSWVPGFLIRSFFALATRHSSLAECPP